mgnify:CR=1 FL=1
MTFASAAKDHLAVTPRLVSTIIKKAETLRAKNEKVAKHYIWKHNRLWTSDSNQFYRECRSDVLHLPPGPPETKEKAEQLFDEFKLRELASEYAAYASEVNGRDQHWSIWLDLQELRDIELNEALDELETLELYRFLRWAKVFDYERLWLQSFCHYITRDTWCEFKPTPHQIEEFLQSMTTIKEEVYQVCMAILKAKKHLLTRVNLPLGAIVTSRKPR